MGRDVRRRAERAEEDRTMTDIDQVALRPDRRAGADDRAAGVEEGDGGMTDRRCGTCGLGEPPWNGIVQVMSLRLCDWKPLEPVPYWVNFPIRPLMGTEDGTDCAAWKEKTE